MERNEYLNKAIGQAKNAMNEAKAQQTAFNNIMNLAKSSLLEMGVDKEIINKIEKAAKTGDTKTIIELQNKFRK